MARPSSSRSLGTQPASPPADSPDISQAAASFEEGEVRDVGAIRADAWPRRDLTPCPKGRTEGFQVIFQKPVLQAIHAHGKSLTQIEICGFLIGNVFHDDRGPFLHITGSIEGRHATHHAAQVTFTSATWDYAHEVLEQAYPGQRIVGWYHTHPDFGVFLSGMDLFIQDNFFNLPWQVALVYDPVRGDEGVFIWRNATSERVAHLVHDGTWTDESATDPSAPAAAPAAVDEHPPPPDEPESPPASKPAPRRSLLRGCLRALDRFFDE